MSSGQADWVAPGAGQEIVGCAHAGSRGRGELRWLDELTEASLNLSPLSREQALMVLRSGDDVLLDVVAAAARVRRAFFGNKVKLNYLVNMKSGLCSEDCHYCSQRRGSLAGVLRYNWLSPEVAAEEAERAAKRGAKRVCLVASGRGPSERDLERVERTIGTIKERLPELEICVCLGILGDAQAERLKAAGAFAYNHNLNTAEARYSQICETHSFAERVATVRRASAAGLSACSGVIVGMGESDEELVDVALSLRELQPASVPVNFLMPFPGTPLEGCNYLTPSACLRALAMFRFAFPDREVRIAGGREMHLRALQPLGLHIANSVFLGDYLTSEGAAASLDLQMIADAGFVVEGAGDAGPAASAGTASTVGAQGEAQAGGQVGRAAAGRSHLDSLVRQPEQGALVPTLRRRGPGTDEPPNA